MSWLLNGIYNAVVSNSLVDTLHNKISSLVSNVSANPTSMVTPVATVGLLEKLADSFPATELTENNVKPIVDSAIKEMCTVMPPDLRCPDVMPPGLLSRIIWYSGPKLQL